MWILFERLPYYSSLLRHRGELPNENDTENMERNWLTCVWTKRECNREKNKNIFKKYFVSYKHIRNTGAMGTNNNNNTIEEAAAADI